MIFNYHKKFVFVQVVVRNDHQSILKRKISTIGHQSITVSTILSLRTGNGYLAVSAAGGTSVVGLGKRNNKRWRWDKTQHYKVKNFLKNFLIVFSQRILDSSTVFLILFMQNNNIKKNIQNYLYRKFYNNNCFFSDKKIILSV